MHTQVLCVHLCVFVILYVVAILGDSYCYYFPFFILPAVSGRRQSSLSVRDKKNARNCFVFVLEVSLIKGR